MAHEFTRISCGLDWSKADVEACFGALLTDATFKVKRSKKFANTAKGISDLCAWIKQSRSKYDPDETLPFQILMEPTSTYHEAGLDQLYQAGLPVCLEQSLRIKKYLHSLGQYSKTDRLDAKGICRMAAERKLRPWKPYSENIMRIRSAIRYRKQLIKSILQMRNQLHALEYSNRPCSTIMSSLRARISSESKHLEKVEKQIHKLYQEDVELVEKLQPLEDSMKGVGSLTLLTIMAETNGFSEVTSRSALARYAGMDIVCRQSGNMDGRRSISKRGNKLLRSCTYMSALGVAKSKEGALYAFYQRIKERNQQKGGGKVAIVALQRKLLLLIFTLVKKNESYDPKYGQPKEECLIKNAPEKNSEAHGIAHLKQEASIEQ